VSLGSLLGNAQNERHGDGKQEGVEQGRRRLENGDVLDERRVPQEPDDQDVDQEGDEELDESLNALAWCAAVEEILDRVHL
jgi:hypothetical protein